MVDLVRAGRDPAALARAFEPSAQAIRNWVAQAGFADGRQEKREPTPSQPDPAERDERARLRRKNKQLRVERDILSRAAASPKRDAFAAGFARETAAVPSGPSGS